MWKSYGNAMRKKLLEGDSLVRVCDLCLLATVIRVRHGHRGLITIIL